MTNVAYSYSKMARWCDERAVDMFRSIPIVKEDGSTFFVPIIWGSKEKALQVARAGHELSGVPLDKLTIPIMNVISQRLFPIAWDDEEDDNLKAFGIDLPKKDIPPLRPFAVKYELSMHSIYQEDQQQTLGQIFQQFELLKTFKQPDGWHTKTELSSVSLNNEDTKEPFAKNEKQQPVFLLRNDYLFYFYTYQEKVQE